jgi:hypothetical protein
MIHPDDYGLTYSSEAEWDSAAALELGAKSPQRAWVLTDRDVWYANPFYKGPPVRHPEDDHEEDQVRLSDELAAIEERLLDADLPDEDDYPF